MDTNDILHPYLIEVNQEDIKDILTVLDENDMLKRVKVTTILGDDWSFKEIYEELLNSSPKRKCKICCKLDTEICKICEKYYCWVHINKCKLCKNYVCNNDTTISFQFYHNGEEICKTCNKMYI